MFRQRQARLLLAPYAAKASFVSHRSRRGNVKIRQHYPVRACRCARLCLHAYEYPATIVTSSMHGIQQQNLLPFDHFLRVIMNNASCWGAEQIYNMSLVPVVNPLSAPPPHHPTVCVYPGGGVQVQRRGILVGRHGRHQPPGRGRRVDLLPFSVPRRPGMCRDDFNRLIFLLSVSLVWCYSSVVTVV